jgi:hypothetical protein
MFTKTLFLARKIRSSLTKGKVGKIVVGPMDEIRDACQGYVM